jgi:glycosyltransferase involved in cell wall biosynthesis
MAPIVTVALPVLDGGPLLGEVLAAVRAQELDRPVELLVVDSGSSDGSPELARRHGARVVEIPRAEFGHGRTRNRLMEESTGDHVAFLTQDSTPHHERWLAALLRGFALADDVALVTGPYLPRPDASPMVRRELRDYFAGFGGPRVDRGAGEGPHAYFSSANGAVARWAWERVPFRQVAYAEDQQLARDMLAAGLAKAYVPDAAVVHSHEYGALEQFRRSFDEWRGLREVHGWIEPFAPGRTLLSVQSHVRADLRSLRGRDAPRAVLARELVRSIRHWTVRAAGAAAGSRADRLPRGVRRWCSLERRA